MLQTIRVMINLTELLFKRLLGGLNTLLVSLESTWRLFVVNPTFFWKFEKQASEHLYWDQLLEDISFLTSAEIQL